MNYSRLKVLHICTTDKGGAGLCCLRIHKALLGEGIDSRVLTLNKKSRFTPYVYQYGCLRRYGSWHGFLKAQVSGAFRAFGISLNDRSRIRRISKLTGMVTSLPVSSFDLSLDPLVQQADIIHLHWVGNFVDMPSFLQNVKKPIVWTLHDENIFHGIFHYDPGEYKDNLLEKKYYELKRKAMGKADNIGIVFLSRLMYGEFANNLMISGKPRTIINNPVDYHMFSPVDKEAARRKLGIPSDKTVFTFVTGQIANPRKGLRILSETLQQMDMPNAYILAVGSERNYKPLPLVHAIGPIYNPRLLAIAYSCSDYFVLPSTQDAFALTAIEAMSCGIPAIVFPVGCSEDLITPQNGVCAKGFTSEDLQAAIRQAMATRYDAAGIRQDIINRFSPSVIARKYIAFYREMLERFELNLQFEPNSIVPEMTRPKLSARS